MHNDEVIWNVISPVSSGFCSYRATLPHAPEKFCRNPYNVTGICSRNSCPLANGRYATVRDHKGILYLFIKTVERAHSPKKLWEKIKLSASFPEALKQIDEQLAYWPIHMKHKCKARMTKLRQMMIRMRKLRLQPAKEIIPVAKRAASLERKKEKRAEIAAKIDVNIKKELLDRLRSGTYEGIYNLDSAFNKVLEEEGELEDDELLEEMEEGDEDQEFEEGEEEELERELEFEEDVSDLEDGFDNPDLEDSGIMSDEEGSVRSSSTTTSTTSSTTSSNFNNKKRGLPAPPPQPAVKKQKRAHVNIEYEQEFEGKEKQTNE